jgi:O-antigen ligase
MTMSLRYFAAAVLGVVFASVCMAFVRRLPDILLYLMVLCVPLFTFEKTLMLRDTWVDFGTPGFNVGPLDVLLLGLYALWGFEVVGLRSRPVPRLRAMDGFVLAYVAANVLSLVGSASRAYTMFEGYRVVKYALAYFYVAHRLERRHLKGVVAALMVALVLESALGVFQYRTHRLVGVARSKGAFSAEMEMQYEVPEFEGHRRAEGTTIDSHALGAYFCVLLPYPLCLAVNPWLPARLRACSALAFCLGVPGLIATFSRGGWGGFLVAAVLITAVFALVWRERRVLRAFLIIALMSVPAVVAGGGLLLSKRIFRAPGEIMSARWDTILTGYEVWKLSPVTGRGANAYFHAQRDLGRVYDLTNDKPAHNLLVYLVAQTGVVGLLTYCALGAALILGCARLIRQRDRVLGPLALAVLAGTAAVQADGVFDFMAFTNQVYFMQFFSCGLVAGMLALGEGRPAPVAPAVGPAGADACPAGLLT